MKDLIQGQKVKLLECIAGQEIEIEVTIDSPRTIDISCFGLDEKRQLSDDRYMIFYNQMQSPECSLQMLETSNGKARFKVDLRIIPKTIIYYRGWSSAKENTQFLSSTIAHCRLA